MLPQKLYEGIRWTIAIALPAVGIFLTSLAEIWELEIPAGQISLTLDAIGLFLGALFGISKLAHDSSVPAESSDSSLKVSETKIFKTSESVDESDSEKGRA